MSTPWASPDPRPVVAAPPAFGAPPAVPPDPPLSRELLAGTLAALAVLVCGPVVGLLWAALAPRAALGPDGVPQDRETSAFIAGDAVFLAVVALTGALTGVLAWRLARRYALGVVLGLLLGGLAAALLAQVVGEGFGAAVSRSVGELLGRADAGPAAAAGAEAGPFDFRLRTPQAVVGWPIGALLGLVAASLLAGRSERRRASAPQPAPPADPPPASSG